MPKNVKRNSSAVFLIHFPSRQTSDLDLSR